MQIIFCGKKKDTSYNGLQRSALDSDNGRRLNNTPENSPFSNRRSERSHQNMSINSNSSQQRLSPNKCYYDRNRR